MTDRSREAVVHLVCSLNRIFGGDLYVCDFATYAESLEGLDFDSIYSAAVRWIKTQKRMPFPAELRELASADEEAKQPLTPAQERLFEEFNRISDNTE